ncbi:hypothetical protein [Bradyrhizobium sp. BR 10289]|uniref:hypothetical protein n=1 Tax=Bradyrhizobium sp. BR 10289 TaxID=2749993 RepID=UPI001C64B430|nr:hypothetical protein [Bradyrhizobium sp. BR 10289]MBW7970670.1 hypothetical protein [Bradyrhizobium sp. BR 10289]
MSAIWKTAVLALLAATSSISIALCEEAIKRAPDGRYLVDLNGVTVALPDEDPKNQQTGFYVSTPPGRSPLHFYLHDLLHDPDRLVPKLRSSEWSSVSVGGHHSLEIIGIPVARGVNGVGILVGVDKNCEAWLAGWSRLRDAAVDLAPDQYGWTRQEFSKSTGETMFIRFLDEGDRRTSRYYAVHCGFDGGCSTRACRDGLTARIAFYSSDKPRGQDYSVREFDEQIASGRSVLERLLVNRTVDLSHR